MGLLFLVVFIYCGVAQMCLIYAGVGGNDLDLAAALTWPATAYRALRGAVRS